MEHKEQNLTLLVVILHDLECFGELLHAWKSIGVPGVTILQSLGGFQAQSLVQRSGLTNLLGIFDQGKTGQRTLLALIDDPDMLARAMAEADRVVRGFDRPSSGILFTLPVGNALGLKKWGVKPAEVDAEAESEVKTGTPALLSWFEEELKARGEAALLKRWREQRSTPISGVTAHLKQSVPLVRTDDPLTRVVQQMSQNSLPEIACVINSEQRLVGMIAQYQLGETMLVSIIPEEFMDSAEDYSLALDVARGIRPQIAADIMQSPVYISLSDTLEVAYQRMHRARLVGLPVVDEQYHVLGYLSLLDILAYCYPAEGSDA
jgi:predicted transcriptional regulator